MLCVLYAHCCVFSFVFSPKGSDCGLVNVNIPTSGAEIGGAFGACCKIVFNNNNMNI